MLLEPDILRKILDTACIYAETSAYCRLCHQSAIYYKLENRPYVKLVKLIVLIILNHYY